MDYDEAVQQQAGEEAQEEVLLSLKEQKELFVTGHDGSTAWEVLLVCSAAPIGIWLFHSLRQLQIHLDERNRRERKRKSPPPTASSRIVTEAIVLWLPFVLCQTNWLYPWGLILLWGEAQTALLIFIYFWSVQRLVSLDRTTSKKKIAAPAAASAHLSTVDENLEEDDIEILVQEEERRLMKDVMTVYRSSLLYMTFVAILAVDFHLFPRRFAKTEVSGYGLMDLGAASFIIAAGLVSPRARYQGEIHKRISFGKKDFARILPLLALGFIRLATNKGLEYQEHVSEYGVHWNFFFTLAIVTPLGSVMPGRPNWLLPAVLLGAYQYALTNYDLQAFIEDGPRTHCAIPGDAMEAIRDVPVLEKLCTLVAANREGVLGCIGYLSMYLFGEYIAYAFLWTQSAVQRQAFFWILTAGLWLTLYGLKEHLHIPVSRRSTNSAFCIWALAHNTTLLAAIRAALNLYQDLRQLVVLKPQARQQRLRPRVPMVFQAVNRHGFLAFLIANLLTGLVNLSINTLHVSDPLALLIVILYICAVGGASLVLHYVISASRKSDTEKVATDKQKEE